jgi:phosphoglycolate phosphatase
MIRSGTGKKPGVVFDLDGTLVDSLPGIAEAYRHVFNQLGIEPIPEAEIRQLVGPPIQVVLQERLGLSGSALDEGVKIFRSHYGTQGLSNFSIYNGIDELLAHLSEAGVVLYIATSKLQTMAIEVVAHAGWTHRFAQIGGATLDGSLHLKADVLRWTVSRMEWDIEPRFMVGDRAADIHGGREVGLQSVGVTWGYGDIDELEAAGADAIVDSPFELESLLVEVQAPLS